MQVERHYPFVKILLLSAMVTSAFVLEKVSDGYFNYSFTVFVISLVFASFLAYVIASRSNSKKMVADGIVLSLLPFYFSAFIAKIIMGNSVDEILLIVLGIGAILSIIYLFWTVKNYFSFGFIRTFILLTVVTYFSGFLCVASFFLSMAMMSHT